MGGDHPQSVYLSIMKADNLGSRERMVTGLQLHPWEKKTKNKKLAVVPKIRQIISINY